jgi:hypothetical protein
MERSFKGGCSCGAVRYECTAEPVFTGNCHCRDCQRASGGGFMSVLGVPRDALKVAGEAKYFEVKDDSGNLISRGFCPNCGSRLFSKLEAAPTMIGIAAGSLDDPGWYGPAIDIYTSRAQPWSRMDPALPKFPKMPQMDPTE